MNNRGQVVFYAMMIAIVFIVFALGVSPVIKQTSDNAMNKSTDNSVGLDCSNVSISKYDKATCVTVDLMNPYFIGFLVFFAGVIITAKIVYDGGVA